MEITGYDFREHVAVHVMADYIESELGYYAAGAQDFGEARQLYIDPVECIDCAACVPVCPVEAIFPDDEVPEQWRDYIGINAGHFE